MPTHGCKALGVQVLLPACRHRAKQFLNCRIPNPFNPPRPLLMLAASRSPMRCGGACAVAGAAGT